MAFKLVSALLLVAAPLSMAQYGGYRAVAAAPALAVAGYNDDAHWGPAEYAFEYAVHDDHTKDIHSHKESRKGDRTDGEYSLVEPDGTIRTVKYYVDGKSGFVAEVIRSGHAVHAPAVIAKPVVAPTSPLSRCCPPLLPPAHLPPTKPPPPTSTPPPPPPATCRTDTTASTTVTTKFS
ncbi:Hypothetical predicted protein [Cloeon dipterum]|uniref:Uncharacterized protein n=1 Tax=Cloeon dipterum TaxID=197152 RepID=A0A8S1DWV7_9INSE|nr:Hypothetical predicted protein [Cloeon dipterum]